MQFNLNCKSSQWDEDLFEDVSAYMLIQRPVHQFFGLENCTVALIALARILRPEINLKYEKYGTNWYPVVILGHVINLLMWLIG